MPDASLTFARRELTRGTDPRDIFAWLAGNGRSAWSAALAVCLALGIPRPEAEHRLTTAGLRNEAPVEPDLLEDLADTLADNGLFTPPT